PSAARRSHQAPRTDAAASSSAMQQADIAVREANAKAARARALGAPEAEVRAALAAEIAQITARYGLAPSGGR
ncbi:MAG TPA: hypothetical protein VFK09_03020, partial [Gemmatimonadales bacterium]|nr:hypothetical protein [Gemmatimonadales bacterium]